MKTRLAFSMSGSVESRVETRSATSDSDKFLFASINGASSKLRTLSIPSMLDNSKISFLKVSIEDFLKIGSSGVTVTTKKSVEP